MSISILDRLIHWTKDDEPLQFVKNVLSESSQHKRIALNSANVQKAQEVMKKCFADECKGLTKACLPFLEKLDNLVTKLSIGSDECSDVLKTIQESIHVLNKRSPFNPPPPIFNLITEYLPRYERAQVRAEISRNPSDAVAKEVCHMNEKEIEALGDLVLKAFRDGGKKNQRSAIIREMSQSLRPFFLFATLDQQDYFFIYTRNKMKSWMCGLFSNFLFQALPLEMTRLSLIGNSKYEKCFSVAHFIAIRERLTKLQILRLKNISDEDVEACISQLDQGLVQLEQLYVNDCRLESLSQLSTLLAREWMRNISVLDFQGTMSDSRYVQALVNNPLVEKLQELHLTSLFDWDFSAQRLAKSHYLTNLRVLNLSFYKGLSDAGVIALANSPAMSNLKRLNLSYSWQFFGEDSSITDYAITVLANSRYMKNLEELDLSGMLLLTDLSVMAIINSPHLKKLKRVKLYECPKITVDAMWQLNHFLSKNQDEEDISASSDRGGALMPYRQAEVASPDLNRGDQRCSRYPTLE